MILADPADASADRAVRVHAFDRPLKELARSRPSAVISLYSTSATNFGSTQAVLGALTGFDPLGSRKVLADEMPLEAVNAPPALLFSGGCPFGPDREVFEFP